MVTSAKVVRKELHKSTSSSVGGQWFGFFVLCLGIPPLILGSVLVGDSGDGFFHALWRTLQLCGGFLVLSGTTFWLLNRFRQKKQISANRERLLWQFIKSHQGRISAGQLASASGWSLEHCRRDLQALCDTGEGELAVLPGGRFQYVFEDFLPLLEGSSARDPMADLLSDLPE